VYWKALANVWNFWKIEKETPAVRWHRPSLSKLACAVAMPPAALMMAWNCFEGVRLRLRRLRCGDFWWPRLWSGIWT